MPLYVLKNIISAFDPKNLRGDGEEPLGEDPWKNIFPSIFISTDSDYDDDSDDLSSHDSSEDEDDSESDSDIYFGGIYFGEVGPPEWKPARFTSTMIRRLYPQVTSNDQIQLCRRGATPGMIERFQMRFDHDHGIVAIRDDHAQIFLGWNILLHPGDERDGVDFMEWVENNILYYPEFWRGERGERGPGQYGIYRRVLPRMWNGELLQADLMEESVVSESDESY